MQRVDRMDFAERFPLPNLVPSRTVRGMHNGSVLIERDTSVLANIQGDVVIRTGAHALVKGMITGSIDVEAGAVGYFEAIIRGNVTVRGAASIQGIVSGDVRVEPDATLAIDGLDTIVSGTVSGATASAQARSISCTTRCSPSSRVQAVSTFRELQRDLAVAPGDDLLKIMAMTSAALRDHDEVGADVDVCVKANPVQQLFVAWSAMAINRQAVRFFSPKIEEAQTTSRAEEPPLT